MSRVAYQPTARDRIDARRVDQPRPGFWLTRMVKGGPLVPALIFMTCPWVEPDINGDAHPDDWCFPSDRTRQLHGMLGGKRCDADAIWTRRGEPCTADEYEFRLARAQWAKTWAPDQPEADPRKPITSAARRSLF